MILEDPSADSRQIFHNHGGRRRTADGYGLWPGILGMRPASRARLVRSGGGGYGGLRPGVSDDAVDRQPVREAAAEELALSAVDRRAAARANQRAAAFIRFQLLGDHEAMHYLLTDLGQDEHSRLAFITALASIAGSVSTRTLGRDGALDYLRLVAENSAALSDADDIDRYFDDDTGT